MTRLVSIFLLVAINIAGYAQPVVTGSVIDTLGQPISFANIVFFKICDTIPTQGCIAEYNGTYKISIEADRYRLQVSYVGYHTIIDTLDLISDTICNFMLTEQTINIAEVLVKTKAAVMSTEKNTYIVKPEDVKNQPNALNLLNKIPKISVDLMSSSVSGIGNKPVKLLLNGADVSSTELKAIRPDKIQKIERYDIPPARYADYEIVLNIITKEAEDGFMATVDLNSAFTTGFASPQLMLQYNWHKKNRLTVDYFLGYRNYKHHISDYSYEYKMDSVHYQEMGHLDRSFGYEQHLPNISYVRQDSANLLQIKISPNYVHTHSDADSNNNTMNYFISDSLLELAGIVHHQNREFNPVVNVYFSRYLNSEDELAIDVTGTHFSTKNQRQELLCNSIGNQFLNNNADENNTKNSLIGELYYSHIFRQFKLKTGYILNLSKQKSDANNTLGMWNSTATSFTSNYVYSEIIGTAGKLGYNLTVGLTHRKSETIGLEYDAWLFMPRVVFDYSFNQKNILKLQFIHRNREPSISQLRNSQSYVSNNIVYTGNPELKHSLLSTAKAGYSLTSDYIDFSIDAFYNHDKQAIINLYDYGKRFIYERPQNIKSFDSYGIEYAVDGQVSFNDKTYLDIKLMGEFMAERLRTAQFNYTHSYTPLFAQVQFVTGQIFLIYSYRYGSYELLGLESSIDEHGNHMAVGWQPNNRFMLYAQGLFIISSGCKYHTHSVGPDDCVTYNNNINIKDNGNMITLGLRYSFTMGKLYEQRSKNINNSDTDSGTFF